MRVIIMNRIIIFCFFLFVTLQLQAHRKSLWEINDCSIVQNNLYNSDKTFLTFYGDSRVDETDMSFWLGPIIPDARESIQTFGGYGMTSFMIRNHLEKCLPLNDYKIGIRVGLSMGGNNYKYTYPWLRVNQWAVGAAAIVTLADIKMTVDLLKESKINNLSRIDFDGRFYNIMIIGNYPTRTPKDCQRTNYDPLYCLTFHNYHIPAPNLVNPLTLGSLFSGNPFAVISSIAFTKLWIDTRLSEDVVVSQAVAIQEAGYPTLATNTSTAYVPTKDFIKDLRFPMYSEPEFMQQDGIHPNMKGFAEWSKPIAAELGALKWLQPKTKTSRSYSSNYWIAVQKKLEELKSDLELARLDLVEKERVLSERLARIKEIEEQIRDAEYKQSLVTKRIQKVKEEIIEIDKKIADLDSQITDAKNNYNLEEIARLEKLRLIEEEKKRVLAEEAARLEIERIAAENERVRLENERAAAVRAAEIARQQAEEAKQRQAAIAEQIRLAEIERQRREQAAADAQRRQNEMLALCFFFGICRM